MNYEQYREWIANGHIEEEELSLRNKHYEENNF